MRHFVDWPGRLPLTYSFNFSHYITLLSKRNEKWEMRCGKWEVRGGKWEVGSEETGSKKDVESDLEKGNETKTIILIFEISPSVWRSPTRCPLYLFPHPSDFCQLCVVFTWNMTSLLSEFTYLLSEALLFVKSLLLVIFLAFLVVW